VKDARRPPGSFAVLRRAGRSRLVLAAGMPRSGSTMLFNIVRLCLEQNYPGQLSAGWIGEIHRLPPAPVWLLKVHTVPRLLAWRANAIFCSFRDVRDALVSAQRKFGAEPSLERCREYVREDQAARAYADCRLRYEELTAQPESAIEQVGRALAVPVDVAQVLRQLPHPDARAPASGYDRTTLLHPNHATRTVAGDWRQVLPPELQVRIAEEFADWLRANGYPLA